MPLGQGYLTRPDGRTYRYFRRAARAAADRREGMMTYKEPEREGTYTPAEPFADQPMRTPAEAARHRAQVATRALHQSGKVARGERYAITGYWCDCPASRTTDCER